jgi:Flp pilus assembly secretin CpaC
VSVSGGTVSVLGTATFTPFVQIQLAPDGSGGNLLLTGGSTTVSLAAISCAADADIYGASLSWSGTAAAAVLTAADVNIDQYGTLAVDGGLTVNTGNFYTDGVVDLRSGQDMGGLMVYAESGGDGTAYTEDVHSQLLIGLVSASSYSTLDVHGALALSGVTNVALMGNYLPAMGTQFYLLNADIITGTANWQLPTLPPHYYWVTGGANDGRDHDYIRVLFSYYGP